MKTIVKVAVLLCSLQFSSSALALYAECLSEPYTYQGYDLEAWVYASSVDAEDYDRVGYEVYWSWTDNNGPQNYTWGPYLFWLAQQMSDGSGFNLGSGWIYAVRMDAGAVLINGTNADWSTETHCDPDAFWG